MLKTKPNKCETCGDEVNDEPCQTDSQLYQGEEGETLYY